MKRTTLIFLVLGIFLTGIGAYLLFHYVSLPFHFNVTKYAQVCENGYTLRFYGSGGKIRKVKIEKDGQKIGKYNFSADVARFPDTGETSLLFLDADEDTQDDLFVCFCVDDDGDRHYRLFLTGSGNTCTPTEEDFVNPRKDKENGRIISIESYREDTADPEKNASVPFKLVSERREYAVIDDSGQIIECLYISLTYYSETDIYCYSTAKFDSETNALGIPTDRWLSPDQYRKQEKEISHFFEIAPLP